MSATPLIIRGVNTFRIFGAFTKVEEQPDGTLIVEGVASSERRDSQKESITAGAMRKAIPGYLRPDGSGPLREMHQLSAAGKTVGITVADDAKTYISTKVVDKEAVLKVKEKVYQGFSIGGTVPPGGRNKDDPTIIERLDLTEISLVDRPANPDAMFTLVKIADVQVATPVQTSAQVPAAAAAPTNTPPPATASGAASPASAGGAAPVAKGMYQVGWLAELCGALVSLANDVTFEADYEGDNSKIPGRLKSICADLADTLKDLATEEADELVAAKVDKATLDKPGALKKSEKLAAVARAFLAAAKGEDFATRVLDAEQATGAAGAELRKALAERDELQRQLRDATLSLKAKGVPQDPKFLEAVTKAEELEKAVKTAEDATEQAGAALRKVLVERDELQLQRDALQRTLADASGKAGAELEKVIEERNLVKAQLDEYVVKYAKAEVLLKTKGSLRVVPIEKAQDTGLEPVTPGAVPPENTPERVLYELKKVQRSGGRPFAILGPTSAPGETR